MRTLILVDLDNVLRPLSRPEKKRRDRWYLPDGPNDLVEWHTSAAPAAAFVRRDAPALDEQGAVVVIAFNQDTARACQGRPLRAGYLLTVAEALARKVGVVGEIRVEPVIVAAVPQAVDFAILRAVTEASDESTVGPFGAIVLFTDDAGLQASVGRASAAGEPTKGFPRPGVSPLPEGRWRLAHPLRRRYHAVKSGEVVDGAMPSGWSARVERAEHVVAVGGVQLTWDSAREFSALSVDASPRVELSSILGPTATTMRGVARLGALASNPTGTVPIGAVDPSDGLEVVGDVAFTPCAPTAVEPASVVGAVRFPESRLTLATVLPYAVFPEAVARQTLTISAPSLNPRAVLAFSSKALVSMAGPSLVVKVAKNTKRHELKFQVMPDDGRLRLRGWWCHVSPPAGQQRAQSELRIPCPRGWTVPELRCEAVVAAVGGRRVDLVAPYLSNVEVSAVSGGWELAIARHGARAALILLPPGRPAGWRAGRPISVAVKRIQLLPLPPAWWTDAVDVWNLLVRAPLLVPCQWEAAPVVPDPGDG